MKPHEPTSTPSPSGRHPEAVRASAFYVVVKHMMDVDGGRGGISTGIAGGPA